MNYLHMLESIAELIILVSCVNAFFFNIIILKKSNKEQMSSNIFLVCILTLFSFVILRGVYIGSNYYLKFPFFLFFPLSLSYSIGILFYIYSKSLVVKTYKISFKESLHFVPLLIQFTYYSFLFTYNSEAKLLYFESVYFPKVLIFEDFVGIFIFAIYLVKFFKLLKKLKKDNFSIKNYEYYKWIKNLSFIFTIILIVWVLTYVIDYIFFDFGLSFTNYYHVYTLFAFLQFWVIYTGFFSTSRIQPKNFTKKQIGNFSAEELEYFKNIIVTVIQTKKLYLKSDFDIKQLSIETEINVSYLSIILNSEFHMNFHNFINKFRIEYSKKELLNSDNKNKTIEAISKDCGFKSKTTFNAAFKKMTSMTPTEYMKLHNKL